MPRRRRVISPGVFAALADCMGVHAQPLDDYLVSSPSVATSSICARRASPCAALRRRVRLPVAAVPPPAL
jgi:hypothetical protein